MFWLPFILLIEERALEIMKIAHAFIATLMT